MRPNLAAILLVGALAANCGSGAWEAGRVLLAAEALLGNDLLVWLVLALGAAMVVGNVAALVRPPRGPRGAPLPAAPRGRSIAYVAVGALVGIWALATLLTR